MNINDLKNKLRIEQSKANECVTEHGHVMTGKRYEYQKHVARAKELKMLIEKERKQCT